jgi:hypothetical protein
VFERISGLLWRRLFLYPIQPAPRTAVLLPGFRSQAPIRVFEQGWNDQARAFSPQAVAGTLAQLDGLIAERPRLTHAIIVLRFSDDAPLSEPDRERLWSAFRVPVFEQIVDAHGGTLAAECEAHNGLHLQSSALKVSPESVDTSPCACGRKTPRIGVEDPREMVRRVVAYAR